MPIMHVIDTRIPVKCWLPLEDIEPSAVAQLCNVAKLPITVKHVAVMPDVHTGFGATIGTVMATKDAIVPNAVGVDIGCGMMAIQTTLEADKVRAKIAEIRHSIERSIPSGFHENKDDAACTGELRWEGWQDVPAWIESPLLAKAKRQLGTLGGGNHFIEVCIDTAGAVWVMLHSGSRNVGLQIARKSVADAKALMIRYHIGMDDPDLAFLPQGEEAFDCYWQGLQWAQGYAKANRQEMARRILKDLAYAVNDRANVTVTQTIDCHHNYAERENHFGENLIITRKGAIRAREGDMGIIPGSMGAKSFIVRGIGNDQSFCSSSHGAGRKMSRKEAKRTFTVADLEASMAGIEGRKDAGVLDEAPGAYKSIDEVMRRQVDLTVVEHELHQIMVIKGGDR